MNCSGNSHGEGSSQHITTTPTAMECGDSTVGPLSLQSRCLKPRALPFFHFAFIVVITCPQ